MVVGASPNSDGSSPRTGTTTVAGVNLSAGTVTLTSAAAITSFADNDFLFNAGDVGTCWEGMETCTPLTAPTGGDSFRGADRSVYPELLSGSRLTTTVSLGQTIEESIGQAAIAVSQAGGKITDAVLNSVQFWTVARRQNANLAIPKAGGDLELGFESIYVSTPAGRIRVWSDPDCPTDRCRGFNMDSHYIRTLGDFVHIIMDDGERSLRVTNADSIEARTRSMGNYIQNNTRDHFVFQPGA
jgi:hypothetical protein